MDYKLPPENSSQLSDTPPKVLSDGLAASNFTAYSLFFATYLMLARRTGILMPIMRGLPLKGAGAG